jgi:hypothetical protein
MTGPRLRPLAFALLWACAMSGACASTPSPDRTPVFAPDPDTAPLPEEPRGRIDDPRRPPAAPAEAPASAPDPADAVATAGPPAQGSVAAKPKTKPPAAPAAECGSKDAPCPMQKLMRGMASASTPEALAAAFKRVATLSPNPSWQWAAIANKGAELARSADIAAAKKQCKACHDPYRNAYKAQYRARKL